MPHYILDARTATPHFPGIGRYVTHLARALVPLLAPDERLVVLHNPAHPLSLPPSEQVQPIPVSASPFSLRQQWQLPFLLRRLSSGMRPASLQRPAVSIYHSPYYLMPYRPGLPTVLTNCSNNYGPYHFPEKLIPVTILNALRGKPIPVYGIGENIRDWLYVEDHADALLLVLEKGATGRSYNIGGAATSTSSAPSARFSTRWPPKPRPTPIRSPSSPTAPATTPATPSTPPASATSLAGGQASPSRKA